MQDEYNTPITEQEANYREFLLERHEILSNLSVNLRKSYTENRANREAQFQLISLALELWQQLFPKVQGTELEKDFKKFTPFYVNPRFFLLPKYENYLWLLVFQIRLAYEQLGLTGIK